MRSSLTRVTILAGVSSLALVSASMAQDAAPEAQSTENPVFVLGTIYLSADQEVFVGMEFGQSREYSEQSAAAIDQEVKRLLDECYARACKLLKDHMDKLIAVAEALLERDTLTRADFECVMRGEPLPPMTDVEKMQPSSEAQADPTPDAQTDGAVTPGFATQDAQEDGDPFVEPKDGE